MFLGLLQLDGFARARQGRRSTLSVMLLLACWSTGCATGLPGPRGPLRGPGVQVAGDYQFAFSHARATLPDGGEAAGNSDYFWSPVAIFPRRFELRGAILPWFDVGGDIGWLDGGLDARVGLPAAPGVRWALQLAGGVRSGAPGFFEDTKSTNARWLRLEVYPLIRERRMGDGSVTQIRAVLGFGVSDGRFGHQLSDPRPDPNADTDSIGPHAIWVEREETHLDFALGADFFGHPAAGTLLVQGYAVLDSSCADCDDVASYSQGWGASLVLRGAVVIGPGSRWKVKKP